MSRRKKQINIKFIIIILALICIATVFIYYNKYYKKITLTPQEGNTNIENKSPEKKEVPKKEDASIIKGNDRIIAVMIDNEQAALPHSRIK